ncbi:MAG: TldD/PmbA family protein [Candidatus Dormiibacterota bacterium]
MLDLAQRALDRAVAGGAGYADARYVQTRHQEVSVKDQAVDGLTQDESEGIGIRVLVDGAWGFAATSALTGPEVEATVEKALAIARASARVHHQAVDLGPPVVSRGRYHAAFEVDPFSVSLDTKVAILLEAEKAMRQAPQVRIAEASAECTHWRKLFVSSEGAEVEQEAYETGAGIECAAVDDDEIQKRSYPNSFGRQVGQGGWELVEAMDLASAAPQVADEACILLTAPQCPSEVTTIILDADQVALQVHESCGHPVELDRVFGMEAAYAGTSFMTPDLLGKLRYGSDKVTIVADATVPGALGTFGWDDEGVAAQRATLIDRGLFVGYLTSRETVTELARKLPPGSEWLPAGSMGSMRADGWGRIPLIRMTNINLEPGESSLDEMIAGTEKGILLRTNKSWSIDDRRLNFQFGTEIAFEVKDGEVGQVYKNATYAGITPDFWSACDAIAGPADWRMFGLINCGKGQPGQTMRVGHGAAPARFRDVRVGIS